MTQTAPETSSGSTADPTPSPVAVPQREIGVAVEQTTSDWWGDLASERIPALRWPDAYDVYDDMRDNAQVESVMGAVLMPILRTGWRIDGTDCRPDIVRHIADDLSLPIVGEGNKLSATGRDDHFSWVEHLAVAGDEYLGYGHSVFEQKAVRYDGLWHLHKLGYRPPRTISKFNVAPDAGLISVEQSTSTAGLLATGSGAAPGTRTLGVDRLVVYSRKRKGANWRGRSMLRPAYGPWLLNNRTVRVELILAERAGAPVPIYTASQSEKSLESGQRIAAALRSGQTAGAAIPYGALLKMSGVEGTLPDLEAMKRYNDEQIARAVLAHFLNLGTQTGSWALGSTFADFFTLSLRAHAEDIATTATRHIIGDIVRWNWPGERVPRLVFDEIGSNAGSVVQAIATLVSAGVLGPDESLEQFIRTTLGLPPRDPGSAPRTQAAPAA